MPAVGCLSGGGCAGDMPRATGDDAGVDTSSTTNPPPPGVDAAR
jgi:hypothetical protein